MNTQDMRDKLKDVVETVPRKNEDVIAMYNEKFPEAIEGNNIVPESAPEANVVAIVKNENEYTYVGAGETPPHIIKFMGLQEFTRGKATEVTNPIVLNKIKNNQCFVKGPVDQDKLFANDEKAKADADLQREEDMRIQIFVERENRKA